MTKEFVCIVCPSSCRLSVSDENGELTVSGNACKRGGEHGKSEFENPMRMLTTTVAIEGGTLPRLPVIGSGEVPRAKMGDCLKELYALRLKAPVACGEVVVKDICGTGADVVAGRTMGAVNYNQ